MNYAQRLQYLNMLSLKLRRLHLNLLVRPKTIVFGRTSVLLWFFSLFPPRVISELRGLIAAKFCTMLLSMFNFIIPVQNFGRASPKNF